MDKRMKAGASLRERIPCVNKDIKIYINPFLLSPNANQTLTNSPDVESETTMVWVIYARRA
jgi:hypothetical protein